ncbi:hypothetical protein HK102_002771 [Quaeritorhiza haematococci]|nr:hypothetical protein HK102_002771 [Quaeritorhiza haematococci]
MGAKKTSFGAVGAILVALIAVVVTRFYAAGIHTPVSCALTSFVGCPTWPVHGYVAKGFESVREAFQTNFAVGNEVGASFAAYVGGKKIAELYGGYFDDSFSEDALYDDQSLQLVFSSTKAVTSIVIAYLVDNGVLDYDEKVSTYWPEFAQNGKEDVKISDVLGHRAGLSWLNPPTPTLDEIDDFDGFGQRLAADPHKFNGTKIQGYHATTRGWILNQIVYRATKGRTIGTILREDIIPRIQTDDDKFEFYLGLPEELENRVSPLVGMSPLWFFSKLLAIPPAFQMDPPPRDMMKVFFAKESPAHKSLFTSGPVLEDGFPRGFNGRKVHAVEGPSYNGITNAKTLARLGLIMAGNGKLPDSDESLISESTLERAHQQLPKYPDVVIKLPIFNFTTGGWGVFPYEYFLKPLGPTPAEYPKVSEDGSFDEFAVPTPAFDYKGTGAWVGWAGAGGSAIFWNRDKDIAFSYVMNAAHLMPLTDSRTRRILIALDAAIEKLEKKE